MTTNLLSKAITEARLQYQVVMWAQEMAIIAFIVPMVKKEIKPPRVN